MEVMGGTFRLLIVFGLLIAAVAGCGGGGSTDSSAEESKPFPWLKGPAREFLGPDGENLLATYGREASAAERKQASRRIGRWMRARAARDWAENCRYLSRKYVKVLVVDASGVSEGKVKNCPQALAFFGSQASGDYKNTLSGPIDSLRVHEGQAYALYHGRDGRDWSLPMYKEDGRWSIAIASPTEENE